MSDAAARSADAPAIPPKKDPESLVLRGSPRPVVRFRRGLIIGVTAAVAAGLIGVTWMALEPPSFRLATGEEAADEPLRKDTPDSLANAPASYGDVPQLGPPLPGDLGRPILDHQRSLIAPEESAVPGPVADDAERERAAAEAERQRLQAVREAARTSGVIVPLTGGGAPYGMAGQAPPLAQGESAEDRPPPSPSAPDDPRQRQAAFSSASATDTNPHRLKPLPSPWTLSAGTIIPASLITGLNSDLPGTVLAQVTQNVRDSATGNTVLIPQGARLIGSYDNVVAYGQRRALVVWNRLVFPDGSSIRLDNMPATDLAGYAGLADEVDFHTWRLLKGVALSTMLGVGTEFSLGSEESDLVRAVRESAQQNTARAGGRITSRNLDIQPTITVRPGWPLRAVINKDLILRPWRG